MRFSSGLDPINELEILSLINNMNITILYTAHSLNILRTKLNKICYLKDKKNNKNLMF